MKKNNRKKFLIFYGSGIGDFTIILPVAKAIKEKYENAYICAFNVSDKNRIKINEEIMKYQTLIDDIRYYSFSEKKHSVSLLLKLGFKAFDYGIVCQYNDSSNSKWPYRICSFVCKKNLFLENRLVKGVKFNVKKEGNKQVYQYYLDALKTIGINSSSNVENLFDVKKIESINVSNFIDDHKKYISLCVGTADVFAKGKDGQVLHNNSKQWPYDLWAMLAKKLALDGYNVIFLGGKKEKEEASNIFSEINNDRVINLLGELSIAQSIAVMYKTDILIGADTGLMHCAGALNKKLLVLFGCTDYHEYLPLGNNSYYLSANLPCSPCFGTEKAITCKNKDCMKQLKTETVYKTAKRILLE